MLGINLVGIAHPTSIAESNEQMTGLRHYGLVQEFALKGLAMPTLFPIPYSLFPIPYSLFLLNPFFTDDFGEIDDALTVAPLVVIPGDDFDHIITHDHRQRRIDGTRGISTLKIARN